MPSDDEDSTSAGSSSGDEDNAKASDKSDYDTALTDLRQRSRERGEDDPFTTPELRSYRILEDASWEANAGEWRLRNLAWLLRSKREESSVRSTREARRAEEAAEHAGFVAGGSIVVTALGLIFIWGTAYSNPTHIPWQLLASTSGAVLLLLTTATLLFRVARDSHNRSRRFAEDVDDTRRLEAAVRLALAVADTVDPDVRRALAAVAVQMASPQAAHHEPAEAFPSPMDLMKDGVALAKTVASKD